MSAVTVTYNSSRPWGTSHAPYVSVSTQPIKYGEKWGNVTKISLVGSVSEEVLGISLETFKDNLITTFSSNDKTLIVDGKNFSNCFVDDISVPNQRFYGKLEYSVNLTSYSFDNSSNQVLDPNENFETTENEDSSKTISHNVSARGRDGAAGFNNARTWVDARISGYSVPSGAILMEETESIDRTKSIFSKSRKYKIDENASGTSTFRRYNISTSESLDSEYKTVEISAEYTGGKDTALATIRSAVETVSQLKTIAQDKSGITLDSRPVSQSMAEDENNKKITFTCSFDDNTLFGSDNYYFDYSVSLNEDDVTGVTNISIDGELILRGGTSERLTEINNFISSTNIETYLYGFCNTAYSDILSSPYTLNTKAESVSISKNENKSTLKLSATFNDEDHIAGYSDANWELNVSPPMPYIKTAPSCTQNGYYSFQDFGFLTREAVSTNVSVTAAENTGTSPTTTTVEAQLLSMEAALHTAFAGGGNEYAVNQGRSEQSGENIGGSFQLQKSYETGTELITMN